MHERLPPRRSLPLRCGWVLAGLIALGVALGAAVPGGRAAAPVAAPADSTPVPSSGDSTYQQASGPVYVLPIQGMIDLGLAPFVARVVGEAEAAGARAVLLDIDTFGGRIDAAVQIRDALLEAPVETIAFVHPRAISAGALISLACTTIAIAPGGSIGAATPVTPNSSGGMDAAGEKVTSYMRAEMRSTAERRGRRGDLAEAMVDADVEIEGVSEKGKLLTLTTRDALDLGLADFEAASVAVVLERAGLGGAVLIERRINWAERIARVISHPVLSSFLLSLGFLGIVIELYRPGWGIPGSLGIACLLTFFLGHYIVNLAGLEELLLFAIGIALLALEAFIIPGFGLAGIAGIVAVLASVTLALVGLDWRVSWELGLVQQAMGVVARGVLGFAAGALLAVKLLPRSRAARPFILRHGLASERGYTAHTAAIELQHPAGTAGVALSDLRPAGKIRAGGQRLDAMTEGGYLDRGARVVIREWREGTAVVGPAPEEQR